MDREKVLKKIKQLLAIGERSPYQAEAETAMATAQRMLLRYNLSLADVSDAEFDRDWIAEEAWSGRARAHGQNYVEQIVQTYFLVSVIRLTNRSNGVTRRSTQIFGAPHNVAVGRYAFVFLLRTFRDLTTAYLRERSLPRRAADDFLRGLRDGLALRLSSELRAAKRENPDGANALIRCENQLLAACDSHYGGTTRYNVKERAPASAADWANGFSAGGDIKVRKPLPAGEGGPRGYIGAAADAAACK